MTRRQARPHGYMKVSSFFQQKQVVFSNVLSVFWYLSRAPICCLCWKIRLWRNDMHMPHMHNANGLHPVGFPYDLYISSNEAAAWDQGPGSWIIDAIDATAWGQDGTAKCPDQVKRCQCSCLKNSSCHPKDCLALGTLTLRETPERQ